MLGWFMETPSSEWMIWTPTSSVRAAPRPDGTAATRTCRRLPASNSKTMRWQVVPAWWDRGTFWDLSSKQARDGIKEHDKWHGSTKSDLVGPGTLCVIGFGRSEEKQDDAVDAAAAGWQQGIMRNHHPLCHPPLAICSLQQWPPMAK